MTEPTRTPIDPGFVQRVAQGFKYAVAGVTPAGWFGPSQPLAPVAQDQAIGRQFDYSTGYNIHITPRAAEPVSFAQLRGLADGYDLLRLVIETRKDQLERLPWSIQFRDKRKVGDEEDARIKEVRTRFLKPDGRLSWRQWSRMVLEDLLVIDAPTVYVRKTNGKKLFALEPIDGATIAPKIDDSGRVPLEGPAYQQVIKGVPACDYTATELVYFPRNLRTNKVYGYSPVEQIITTVNIALRRQISQLAYYTEGNLPPILLSAPKEWSVDAIKDFENHFNAMLAGNLSARRKAKMVPDGTKPWVIQESPLKDQFDDWLARITCFAFSISPQALVQMQNRATAQTGAEEATKEGLEPLKLWMKDFVDECILKGFGYDDVEFVWAEEEAIDPLKQAQVNEIYVNAKVLTRNEVRKDLGRDPVEGGDEFTEAPEPVNPDDGEEDKADKNKGKEVGKSANAPFAKFLPDTEEVDAEGQEDAPVEREIFSDEDKQKAAVAAALLLLLRPWRKAVWREIGYAAPENEEQALTDWAQPFASRTMDLVNATTAGKIREAIEQARQSPEQVDIAKKVRDIFRQAKKTRSRMIGDTTATGAFGFAALSAMQDAGVLEARWLTERDLKVRPTHQAMEGQTRPVGTPFTSPSGAMALYPGGFGIAEEDCNCRCALVPVTMAKADSSDDDLWAAREVLRAKGAKKIAAVLRRIFRGQERAVLLALTVEKLAKVGNPWHDAKGRFTHGPETGHGFVIPAKGPSYAGPLPVDLVKKYLGVDLRSGHVRVPEGIHDKMQGKHEEDYAVIKANLRECLTNPDFIGTHPDHPGRVDFVKLVDGLPKKKVALVFAVGMHRDRYGDYSASSAYGLKQSRIDVWLGSGALHRVEK